MKHGAVLPDAAAHVLAALSQLLRVVNLHDSQNVTKRPNRSCNGIAAALGTSKKNVNPRTNVAARKD